MNHLSLDSFKKNLESSFPNDLSNLYLVIVKDDFDRQRIIDNITCYFPRTNAFSIMRFSPDTSKLSEVISNLDSPSLLGGKPIFILDEIELYNRKDIITLVDYLKKSRIDSFFVMAGREKKSILTLFAEVDKRGQVVDLSQEKPWEKQKRLGALIVEKCAQAKKTISADAKETMLSLLGNDMSAIEKEIEKIIVYVGESPEVKKEDILLLCSRIDTSTVWQLAERIIWSRDPFIINLEKDYAIDSSFFNSMIVALRYNLQEGYKLTLAMGSGVSISQIFPFIKPQVLQKKMDMVKTLHPEFFKEALELLFQVDMMSRQGNPSFIVLIDYFRIKFNFLMNYENKQDYTFA